MNKKYVKEFRPYAHSYVVRGNDSLRKMAKLFVTHPMLDNLCVVDENGTLNGIVHRIRLFQAIFSQYVPTDTRVNQLFKLLTSETANDLCSKEIVSTMEDEEIDKVIRKMIDNRLTEIPVLDEKKKILGFITSRMIASEWLLESD